VQGSGWLCLCRWTENLSSLVTNWLAGIAGAYGVGLWLTMLPDAGSRGRFCADMSVGAVSVGPEAKEAGRASAGSTSTQNPKIGFGIYRYIDASLSIVHGSSRCHLRCSQVVSPVVCLYVCRSKHTTRHVPAAGAERSHFHARTRQPAAPTHHATDPRAEKAYPLLHPSYPLLAFVAKK